jgi:hypothetical protein
MLWSAKSIRGEGKVAVRPLGTAAGQQPAKPLQQAEFVSPD